jgi:hypothetical protein
VVLVAYGFNGVHQRFFLHVVASTNLPLEKHSRTQKGEIQEIYQKELEIKNKMKI